MRCPVCLNYTHQCGVTRKCEPYEPDNKLEPLPPEGGSSQTSPSSAVYAPLPVRPESGEPTGFKVHVLKTHPEPFAAIRARTKKFEFRKDDRLYEVGDTLWLDEFDPRAEQKTGEVEVRVVTYLLREGFGIPPGYVVMSIEDPPSPVDPHLSGRQGNTSTEWQLRDEISNLQAALAKAREGLERIAKCAFVSHDGYWNGGVSPITIARELLSTLPEVKP